MTVRLGTAPYLDGIAQLPAGPLREYAVLADGERAALVGPRGNTGFLCARGAAPGHAEGAFMLCGFHLALSSHQQGDLVTAGRWFVHAALLEAAHTLATPTKGTPA